MTINDIVKATSTPGENIMYMAHDFSKVYVTYGAPPTQLNGKGLHYVKAGHLNNQTSLMMSMNAKGIFVENRNKAGYIEFGAIDGSVLSGLIQVTESAGYPVPIWIIDANTGGTGYVNALECKRVSVPTFQRGKTPRIKIYRFETDSLIISEGVRMLDIV